MAIERAEDAEALTCQTCIHLPLAGTEEPCRSCGNYSHFDGGKPLPIQMIEKSALDVQEGGDHYKKLAIQPVEYIHANSLGFCEGSVVKYVTRWRDKGGVKDLEKARHFIDLLIELEAKKGTTQ